MTKNNTLKAKREEAEKILIEINKTPASAHIFCSCQQE